MKSFILPAIALIILSGCTTAYQSGQTPDDVYYSPERPADEYVRTERNDDRRYRYDEDEYRDDRYLRMKIRNRRYVGLYDDYYSYNPYNYHYYNSSLFYNSPWSSYSYWNYHYNPYCTPPVIIKNPGRAVVNRPRVFDLGVYDNNPPAVTNPKGPRNFGASNTNTRYGNRNNNNYRGSGTNAGDFLRDAFGTNNSSSNRSSGTSNSGMKNSNSSSSSSSSGSSSSGSGSKGSTNAPKRKF